MKLICIETSTDICSVCISEDGQILSERETGREFSHSQTIGVFIEECLLEIGCKIVDIDAVAIASGPGSYTALRVGTSFAKGLCYAQDIPLITIPTLDALANSIIDSKDIELGNNDLIVPLLDARRQEVYRTVYNKDFGIIEELSPIVLDEDTFQYLSEFDKIHFVGDGVEKSKEILNLDNAVYHNIECSAKHMITIAMDKFQSENFADVAYMEPNYFKKPNIKKSKKKLL